jgi:hypothetical protein
VIIKEEVPQDMENLRKINETQNGRPIQQIRIRRQSLRTRR